MTDYRYFQTQHRDGVQIIYLGEVGTDRKSVTQMGRDLIQLADAKPQRVLVNFQAVQQLSSAVVGKLLLLVKTVTSQGGRIECCGASEGFRQVLGMLGRSLPFEHADKAEAEVIEILKLP